MARLRRRILVETAMDAVDAHAEAASDPGAARAAIEQLEAELSTFRERLGLREAKLGRKGASEYVKVSEDFIRSNPIRVWNPSSHEWQVLATFEQITAWLALAKVVLMAADASPRAADAVTQPADTGTATEAVAEFTGRASAIIEGMAGIVGTTSLAMAKVLRLAALDSTLDAGPLVAAADRLEKGAVAIGRSKALSGVLAGLSLFRNGAILLDADSTTEQRADALVGIAAAGAEIAGVVTWRALLLRATLDEVWMLHERALRKPDPESIHAFATDLAERVSALLEDLPHLVGVESGILPDRAPSVTSAQAGSFYEQHPTE